MGASTFQLLTLLVGALTARLPLARTDARSDEGCVGLEEAPCSVELLQRNLENVEGLAALALQGSVEATGGSLIANGSLTPAANANATAALVEIGASTNASVARDERPKLGDIIKKVGGAVDNVNTARESLTNVSTGLNTLLVDVLIDIVDSTLVNLQSQADTFIAQCIAYKDELLDSVQESSDKAISNLQTKVTKYVQPIRQLWSELTGTLTTSMPAISAALTAVGQEDIAASVTDVVEQATTTINAVLDNATNIINGLSNATSAQEGASLDRLDTTINAGLETVRSFTGKLKIILNRMITALEDKLGIALLHSADGALAYELAVSFLYLVRVPPSVRDKLSGLKDEVDGLVGTLGDGLDTILNSTLGAAEVALGAKEKDSARPR
eukprot:CAMPEP_0171110072 /NCGR_PEP_ID=MMETSP0766_2-20121228/71146_1 /TAXON_ID=439317 /ORGANISM="Gambierdiscus australes, Strain CAWD 149" /LENGTH=385 /DNA_ID=CAMNT_0011571901 /DNA_START=1 /DNA_END=1155 /DNA_ORIENTATION=-